MPTYKLLRAEILHRKSNFLLSALALVAAATLFVASPLLMNGYGRESDQRLEAKRKQTESELAKLRQQNADDLAAMREETAAKLAAMQTETDSELERMQQDAKEQLANLDKRTKRIMRDLGFNLKIIHRNTELSDFFAKHAAFDMPEEYLQRMAEAPQITKIVHLVASLKQMIQWEDKPRLLVGFAPEATQSHIEKKPPMGFQIKRGTVFLGSVAGQGHKLDEEVEILGKKFTVARILEPRGVDEDILIAMHLKDAQEVLHKEGKITEILALGCKCKSEDRIAEVREQLELVLPEARILELKTRAIARADQRKLVTTHAHQAMADYVASRQKIVDEYQQQQQAIIDREQERQQHMVEREQDRHAMILDEEKARQQRVLDLLAAVTNFISPLVILVCAVWVGFLAWSNVRERRTEIGLLRALGKRSGDVASLFLGRAIIVGLIGGIIGCGLGMLLGCGLAVSLLDVSVESFQPAPQTLLVMILGAVLGTPLISAMASYLPTLSAIGQDPAVVLLEN